MLSDALLWTLCKAGYHCSACSPKDAACGQQTVLAKSCFWLSGSSVSAEPRLPGAKSLTGQGMSCQVQGSPGFPVMYRGPLDCARQIAASEGLRGFYRRAKLACAHGIRCSALLRRPCAAMLRRGQRTSQAPCLQGPAATARALSHT